MTKRELIIKRNQSILLKGQTLKLLQHSFVWAGVGGWVGCGQLFVFSLFVEDFGNKPLQKAKDG